MPLDHYVSQVHLRKFTADKPNKMLHAFRKKDLKQFTAWPKDVCRRADGNTTDYLTEPRAIEEFLKDIEPNYDKALDKIRAGKIDQECIYVLAGFASYIDCCTPGGIRLHAQPLKALLRSNAMRLDKTGIFGRAPEQLGNKTLTELLATGMIKFEVDEKYPQAVGISNLLERLSTLGNSEWWILENRTGEIPFLTSDLPMAIGYPSNVSAFSRLVPLATDLAVRIIPDRSLARAVPYLSFPGFREKRIEVSREAAMEANQQIVRCAETVVFSSVAEPWIGEMVEQNRFFHLAAVTNSIPHRSGIVTTASMRVVEQRPPDTAPTAPLPAS